MQVPYLFGKLGKFYRWPADCVYVAEKYPPSSSVIASREPAGCIERREPISALLPDGGALLGSTGGSRDERRCLPERPLRTPLNILIAGKVPKKLVLSQLPLADLARGERLLASQPVGLDAGNCKNLAGFGIAQASKTF
jgi:hypothetical protein